MQRWCTRLAVAGRPRGGPRQRYATKEGVILTRQTTGSAYKAAARVTIEGTAPAHGCCSCCVQSVKLKQTLLLDITAQMRQILAVAASDLHAAVLKQRSCLAPLFFAPALLASAWRRDSLVAVEVCSAFEHCCAAHGDWTTRPWRVPSASANRCCLFRLELNRSVPSFRSLSGRLVMQCPRLGVGWGLLPAGMLPRTVLVEENNTRTSQNIGQQSEEMLIQSHYLQRAFKA